MVLTRNQKKRALQEDPLPSPGRPDSLERNQKKRALPQVPLPSCMSDVGVFSVVSQIMCDRDLAALSSCCRSSRRSVGPALIARKTWLLSALPAGDELSLVHRVFVDSTEPWGVTLPPFLTHLAFCHGFNQPLAEGVLPSTLQQLTFGRDFNQPLVKGVLPSTLQHLSFRDGWGSLMPLSEVPRSVLPASVRAKLTNLVCE